MSIIFKRKNILQQLYDAVQGVSMHRFISDRPEAMQNGMTDFVIVDLPNGIYDRGDTYQESYCQISVFAKNKANGIEDTVKLDDMLNAICKLFPMNTSLFYASSPRLMTGGDDMLGFHFLIIQAKLIIKK